MGECTQRGVTLFPPSKQADLTANPARRADLSQPVPEDQCDNLPTQTTKHKDGSKTTRLTKDAFIYLDSATFSEMSLQWSERRQFISPFALPWIRAENRISARIQGSANGEDFRSRVV